MLNLVEAIIAHIFGRKYYAVVLEDAQIFIDSKGNKPRSLSGYIFRSKEDARMYYYQMKSSRSKQSVEMVSFRSREEYRPFNDNYKIDINNHV